VTLFTLVYNSEIIPEVFITQMGFRMLGNRESAPSDRGVFRIASLGVKKSKTDSESTFRDPELHNYRYPKSINWIASGLQSLPIDNRFRTPSDCKISRFRHFRRFRQFHRFQDCTGFTTFSVF
jgi:hypothetical protein